jgi:hypothetical protein
MARPPGKILVSVKARAESTMPRTQRTVKAYRYRSAVELGEESAYPTAQFKAGGRDGERQEGWCGSPFRFLGHRWALAPS